MLSFTFSSKTRWIHALSLVTRVLHLSITTTCGAELVARMPVYHTVSLKWFNIWNQRVSSYGTAVQWVPSLCQSANCGIYVRADVKDDTQIGHEAPFPNDTAGWVRGTSYRGLRYFIALSDLIAS